jgi:hypothetical protein
LRQIKISITDLTERKNLWTTANRTIVEKVVEKGNGSGVVGVKKAPSSDIVVQLKEQAGKDCWNTMYLVHDGIQIKVQTEAEIKT